MKLTIKRYLISSGIVAWTFILVISMAFAFIHNWKFQDGPDEMHLKFQVSNLNGALDNTRHQIWIRDQKIEALYREIHSPYFLYGE